MNFMTDYTILAVLPITVISLGIAKVTFVYPTESKILCQWVKNFNFEKRLNYIQSSSTSLVIITSTVSTTYNDVS